MSYVYSKAGAPKAGSPAVALADVKNEFRLEPCVLLPCSSLPSQRTDAAVPCIQGGACCWFKRMARAPSSALPPCISRAPSDSRAHSDRTLNSSGTCKRSRSSLASVSAFTQIEPSIFCLLLSHRFSRGMSTAGSFKNCHSECCTQLSSMHPQCLTTSTCPAVLGAPRAAYQWRDHCCGRH